MSLAQALSGIGVAIGIFVGGAVLSSFSDPALGYPATIATLGAIGLLGAASILLFAKDPCKTPPQS
jgi:hypothetical protein